MQTNASEPGFQATASKDANNNDGLMDVDMMDIAELERERGDPRDPSAEALGVGAAANQEADELARVRLQRQALTFEQKCLIEKIIDDKTAAYTHSIKNQMNTLHLELIKNF